MTIETVREILLERLTKLDRPGDILKAPELKELFSKLKSLPAPDKAQFGAKLNELKRELQAEVDKLTQIASATEVEPLDVTAPFNAGRLGAEAGTRPPSLRATSRPAYTR